MSNIVVNTDNIVVDVNTVVDNVVVQTEYGNVSIQETTSNVQIQNTTQEVLVSSNAIVIETEFGTTVSESEPLVAQEGQQWFNPASQVLSVYANGQWASVGADDLYF